MSSLDLFQSLISKGWVSAQCDSMSDSDIKSHLLSIALSLGTPVASKKGRSVFDILRPTNSHDAKRETLSRKYSTGGFPLHSDTSHWIVPCRYVVLACMVPGNGSRDTLILDTNRVPLTEALRNRMISSPMLVINGRNSFYSTILATSRPFIRYDPGCMIDTTSSDLLNVFNVLNYSNHIETCTWTCGKLLILDNWRVLHGRGSSRVIDSDRTLLRISVI